MKEEIKVDRDYLQAFNLGYELAKELNLSTPMFKGLVSEDGNLKALQAGMAEFNDEFRKAKGNSYDQSVGQEPGRNFDPSNGEEKGWNQSL
ncbi:hypothetical protein [Arenibacter latericius]|uniref:hypothetical protein n=1 Tax=Arenibacter latericius TaxID=86104 RepID=UPI0004118947|nr:hypothetical protein [Arenibacter latericius]